MKIVFVCTGNTCRSPLAEKIALKIMKEIGGHEQTEVVSCGLYAQNGARASEGSVSVAGLNGLDLSQHRARQLMLEHVEVADKIYAMTQAQVNALRNIYPQAVDKIESLAREDITDPFGNNIEAYEKAYHEIKDAILAGIEKGDYK